jgi:hypothetical protein
LSLWDAIGLLLPALPRGVVFKCGHPLIIGNVRLVGGRARCRTCLNESSRRSYERKEGSGASVSGPDQAFEKVAPESIAEPKTLGGELFRSRR